MPTEEQDIKDSFDQILGRKLLGFEEAPPADAWIKINKALSSTSKAGWFANKKYLILSSATILLGVVIFYFVLQKDTSKKVSTENSEGNVQHSKNENHPVQSDGGIPQEPVQEKIASDKGKSAGKRKGQQPGVDQNIEEAEKNNASTPAEPSGLELNQENRTRPTHQTSEVVVPVSRQLDSTHTSTAASPDTVRKISKPKSFYEKKLNDSTLKYRQLFKKKK